MVSIRRSALLYLLPFIDSRLTTIQALTRFSEERDDIKSDILDVRSTLRIVQRELGDIVDLRRQVADLSLQQQGTQNGPPRIDLRTHQSHPAPSPEIVKRLDRVQLQVSTHEERLVQLERRVDAGLISRAQEQEVLGRVDNIGKSMERLSGLVQNLPAVVADRLEAVFTSRQQSFATHIQSHLDSMGQSIVERFTTIANQQMETTSRMLMEVQAQSQDTLAKVEAQIAAMAIKLHPWHPPMESGADLSMNVDSGPNEMVTMGRTGGNLTTFHPHPHGPSAQSHNFAAAGGAVPLRDFELTRPSPLSVSDPSRHFITSAASARDARSWALEDAGARASARDAQASHTAISDKKVQPLSVQQQPSISRGSVSGHLQPSSVSRGPRVSNAPFDRLVSTTSSLQHSIASTPSDFQWPSSIKGHGNHQSSAIPPSASSWSADNSTLTSLPTSVSSRRSDTLSNVYDTFSLVPSSARSHRDSSVHSPDSAHSKASGPGQQM